MGGDVQLYHFTIHQFQHGPLLEFVCHTRKFVGGMLSDGVEARTEPNPSDMHSHKKKSLEPDSLPEKDRISLPARPTEYSFRNYVAYTLYTPLYLAGPIITFNDFLSQVKYPLKSLSLTRIGRYGVRWLLCLLCMEFTLHFLYVNAISKSNPTWTVYTPFQLSMIGYFSLTIIWLKLLLLWRFFRLWSLADGVDPPENFVRCMSNNYSALAFWRGWHRSFNRWCIRYVYIPLGGGNTSNQHGSIGRIRTVCNYAVVFTFVALWHDINLQLLVWGWLITLFVLPEIIGGALFPQRAWSTKPETYRVLRGVGAMGNILLMIVANLVGFAVGVDGAKGLLRGIVDSPSGTRSQG